MVERKLLGMRERGKEAVGLSIGRGLGLLWGRYLYKPVTTYRVYANKNF